MLITKGADIYTVSKLLGHTDIKHTQIYARIVDERTNQGVNLLPALNFLSLATSSTIRESLLGLERSNA